MNVDEKSATGLKKKKKKKRSSSSNHDRDHDKDEDIMVEKFYQIVTSFREARERLIRKEIQITDRVDDDESSKQKRKRTTSSSSSAGEIGSHQWRGEFEKEDFASEADVRVPSPATATATAAQTQRQREEEDVAKRQQSELERHHNEENVVGRLNLDLSL